VLKKLKLRLKSTIPYQFIYTYFLLRGIIAFYSACFLAFFIKIP